MTSQSIDLIFLLKKLAEFSKEHEFCGQDTQYGEIMDANFCPECSGQGVHKADCSLDVVLKDCVRLGILSES